MSAYRKKVKMRRLQDLEESAQSAERLALDMGEGWN